MRNMITLHHSEGTMLLQDLDMSLCDGVCLFLNFNFKLNIVTPGPF